MNVKEKEDMMENSVTIFLTQNESTCFINNDERRAGA